MAFVPGPPTPSVSLVNALTFNSSPPPPLSPPPPPPHPPQPPYPPDTEAHGVPPFDKRVKSLTTAIDSTLKNKVPGILMWIGIAFGALVGLLLVFLVAYCFLAVVGGKPYEKRKPRRKIEAPLEEEEGKDEESAVVGAPRHREQTRARIRL
jgi:hypothetical protein